MKRHTLQWIGIGSLAIVLPVAASAQQAFARGPMDLRAGPSENYPLVANIAPGQPIQVMGCVERLCVVRRGAARRPARLGLCGQPRLRLPGPARAAGHLRCLHRRADRRLLARRLLVQLLPRPALVQPAELVGRPSATAGGRLASAAARRAGLASESVSGRRLGAAAGLPSAGTGLPPAGRRWLPAAASGLPAGRSAARVGIRRATAGRRVAAVAIRRAVVEAEDMAVAATKVVAAVMGAVVADTAAAAVPDLSDTRRRRPNGRCFSSRRRAAGAPRSCCRCPRLRAPSPAGCARATTRSSCIAADRPSGDGSAARPSAPLS